MLRSHKRLAEIATGTARADSNEARDALVHFFQDAFHVRDWIRYDDTVPDPVRDGVFQAVRRDIWLALAADLANGSKHLGLSPSHQPHTGDRSTGFTSQSVTVQLGATAHGPRVLTWWTVTSNGTTHDALDVARAVVVAWNTWLLDQGLSP